MFPIYPYINLTDVNLDYVLKQLKQIEETVKNFITLNSIKYADPIQWNITTQYETNTVVVDSNTGTAYLSVQPVPSGVAITDTDYWTPIFTVGMGGNENITFRDDGSNLLATFTSAVDDWLLWNGELYIVTQNINVNEAYVVGYNITRYSVELFIKDYIDALSNEIGTLSNLTTVDTSSLVNAINELVTRLNTTDNNIGNLGNLNTLDKSSVVNAINEVLSSVPVSSLEWFNVKNYGAVGDNITNDTQAINDTIDALNAKGYGALYFPAGHYYVDDALHTITAHCSIFGDGQGSSIIENHNTLAPITIFDIGTPLGLDAWDMHDLHFIGNSGSLETWIHHIAGNYVSIHDIKISNIFQFAYIGNVNISSILINVYNIRGWTRSWFLYNSGMIAGLNVHDCNIDNSPQNTAAALISDAGAKEFDTFNIYDNSFVGYKVGIIIENVTTPVKSNLFIENNIFDVMYERSIIIIGQLSGNYLRAYIRNNWLTSKLGNAIDIIGTATTKIYQVDISGNEFLESYASNLNMQYVEGFTVNGNQFIDSNRLRDNNVPVISLTNCAHGVINGNLISNDVPSDVATLSSYALICTGCNYLTVTGNDMTIFNNAPLFSGCTNVRTYANLGCADQTI